MQTNLIASSEAASTLKFKTGDRVKIVKYGCRIWRSAEDPKIVEVCDMCSEVVGMTATIREVTLTQNMPKYSIVSEPGGPNKVAWYNEDQLELIEVNKRK